MQHFKYIKEIFFLNNENMKITKKTHLVIEKEAIAWLKTMSIKFGYDRNINEDKVSWHYSCGDLFIIVKGIGSYWYAFIMEMIYFAFTNNAAFMQGYEFGKAKGEANGINRDNNPFKDKFYECAAWDRGYILGVSPYTIESFKALFTI